MYNDIIIIFVCAFAIYGMYALLREICMLFLRSRRIVAGVKVKNDDCLNDELLTDAMQLIDYHFFLEKTPVLLCDRETAKNIEDYGYEVYVKYTEDI